MKIQANALVSYAAYLENALWPSALAVFYHHPATSHALIPVVAVAGAIFLIAGISFFVFRQRVRRPYLIVGWLWYLGTLVPVIGVVQAGMAARADRYTYIPLIGLFIAVAWIIGELLNDRRSRIAGLVAIFCIIVALSVVAWNQAGYWRDSVTLWSRTAAVTEKNWTALNNLGVAKDRLGRFEDAVGHYREALRINPDYAEAWYNLGATSQKLGQIQQAIECYREALRIRPDSFSALNFHLLPKKWNVINRSNIYIAFR